MTKIVTQKTDVSGGLVLLSVNAVMIKLLVTWRIQLYYGGGGSLGCLDENGSQMVLLNMILAKALRI